MKGWAFVVCTGALVYILVHRALRRAAESDIQAQQVATARKQAESALAEERHLLRTLIDNLPDYIFIKDRQSRFVTINRAQADLLGVRAPDDAVGKSPYLFGLCCV